MKNLLSVKSILVYTICLTGPLFMGSSCSENKTVDSSEVAERDNMNRMNVNDNTAIVIDNDHDAEFLMKATEMQLEAISLGELAQQKGNSAEVKEFGKMMVEGHNQSLNELKTLAQSKSVTIPTSSTQDSMDTYNDLNEETGIDFDRSYSDRMVEHHEDAIDLYEDIVEDTEDAEIRNWASQKLTAMRTHLEHAKKVKDTSDNTNS